MSGMAELSQRHARLQEISGIMTAMKSLSLVEARKLARFIGEQARMRDNIAAAAADFLQFHREIGARDVPRSVATLVLIGSERGFCGNFNERIVQTLGRLESELDAASLLVVGHRLSSRLAEHARVVARLDGPTVAEDVPAVLENLVDALHEHASAGSAGPATLLCLGHDEQGEPALTTLLPLPRPAAGVRRGHAPELLLAPQVFYDELVQQFLLTALLGQFYTSLAAENHQRLAHMERALDRLDQTLARLALRRNALRQERIVEEIEVILSSAMAFDRREKVEAASSSGRLEEEP
ncbi:MAG: F0F1 ATP synthase subunit gamma [Burkholderiaceae bacterium]|nr:F0F1 ATP synthase subunit gamma [Burkholderiaceae bacterium]